MSAALSQPDAARFTIYIDAMIESPRLNFTAFCTAARISAAEALTWLNRADIKTALQSCMDVIQLSARIRHAVLDTNAMGTLGQILKTSENQIELRRVATTIISRHKADLRTSRATAPGGTGLLTGASSDSASRATIPASQGSTASRRNAAAVTSPGRQTRDNTPHTPASTKGPPLSSSPAGRTMVAGGADCEAVQPPESTPKTISALCADEPSTSHPRTNRGSHSATSLTSPLSTQYSVLSTSRIEPHSAKTLLTRVGSTRSRDHP